MKESELFFYCNLYKSIREILHPSISKKNISNYKIIIDQDLLPLKVYYPKKVSNLNNILIYIEGDSNITKNVLGDNFYLEKFAKEYNQLIIEIDYKDYKNLYLLDLYKKTYETFKFIYQELLKNNISKENIFVAGDSTGATAILYLINNMNKDYIEIAGQILFYPLLSGEYFGKSKFLSINDCDDYNKSILSNVEEFYKNKLKYKKDYKDSNIFPLLKKDFSNYPRTLIICGSVDFLIDEVKYLNTLLQENCEVVEIPFTYHGFLNGLDFDIEKVYKEKLKEFLKINI